MLLESSGYFVGKSRSGNSSKSRPTNRQLIDKSAVIILSCGTRCGKSRRSTFAFKLCVSFMLLGVIERSPDPNLWRRFLGNLKILSG